MAFLGLPYAGPVSGERRWTAPEPTCWKGAFVADRFGPRCAQRGENGAEGEEDCLTLNVWTPRSRAREGGHPVIVYLHGGSNLVGSSADVAHGTERLYDGARLAAGGAVVVTVNYRLGVLGFLAHGALAQGGATGNYGLLDQIAALEWVQRNVAAFGGDPQRVTLYGQSAGASDACALVASTRAKGLFARAILQSGPCDAAPRDAAEAASAEVARTVGCNEPDPAACLRAAPPGALVETSEDYFSGALLRGSGIHVDGRVLTARPLDVIAGGAHTPVPLLVSSVSEEFASEGDGASPEDVRSAVRTVVATDADVDKVLAHYAAAGVA